MQTGNVVHRKRAGCRNAIQAHAHRHLRRPDCTGHNRVRSCRWRRCDGWILIKWLFL